MVTAVDNKEVVLDAIANMSVMDVVELIKMMEDKFGVSAAAPVVAAPVATGAPAAAEEEKTEFTVYMTSFGADKVKVIKVVREITGLGLKQAKDLVESAPAALKEAIPKADAESISKKLQEAGASVEIK